MRRRCSNRRRVELRGTVQVQRRRHTSQDQSGEVVKASRQGRTLCLAPSSCLALFRNLKFGAGICVDLFAKVKGLITELISPLFQPLHPETGAPLHVKRVIAAADLMCILRSASEMSLLTVFLVILPVVCWCHRVFRRCSICVKLENTVPPVIALRCGSLEASCCCGVTEFSGGGQGYLKLENTAPSVVVMGSTHLPRRTSITRLGVCDHSAILDQSCRLQDCFSAFGSGHWRTVAPGA